MPNVRKRGIGTFAASILMTASALVAVPASAAKPPPPPPPPPEDPWAYCTPYGSYDVFTDCCDYPELIIPCESQTSEPAVRPEDVPAESSGV